MRLWRRATGGTVRPNPMQRPAAARSWTGSPLSIAAPGLFPPSVLATFDEAFGLLAFGTLLVGATLVLLAFSWAGAAKDHRLMPVVFLLAAGAAAVVAYAAVSFGVAAAGCGPEVHGCSL